MKYLLWDIDGTLLLTNYAGVTALRSTIKDQYGIDNFKFSQGMSGRTDSFIARNAIKDIKGSCSDKEITKLLTDYATRLPGTLIERQGHLLPNVVDTLELFAGNPAFTSALLTGNCVVAAHAKLAHFGIDNFFDYNLSAFGDSNDDREHVAATAKKKILSFDPSVQNSDIIVIGDTPHDITCARSIDAPCLVILTGSLYSRKDLAALNPWKIIQELPKDRQSLIELFNE
jgi:phosphoglycolate phosphatase-like HAD superfamily hydrolase